MYKLNPSTYILFDLKTSPLRVLALSANVMHLLRASENLGSNAQAPALTSLFLYPQTASKLPILPRLRHSPKPLPVKVFLHTTTYQPGFQIRPVLLRWVGGRRKKSSEAVKLV